MYTVALVLLLVLGAATTGRGISRRSRRTIATGIAIGAGTLLFFGLLGFWGEMLWFEELGLSGRFWRMIGFKVAAVAGAALLAAVLAAVITSPARRSARRSRRVAIAAAAALGGAWGAISWSTIVKGLMSVTTGLRDPIFGRDTGFYLFKLPFYDALFWFLAMVTAVSAVVAIGSSVVPAMRAGPPTSLRAFVSRPGQITRPIYVVAGVLALLLAWGRVLATYHLMYSNIGTVHGPGWTDVHVRLPANYALAFVLALAGAALLVPATSRALEARALRRSGGRSIWRALKLPATAVVMTWLVGLGLLPVLSQWLMVSPNELALERPYLESSIAFTRRGFGLDRVEERELSGGGALTPELVEQNEHLLSEVRLWDPRALDQVLDQFQVIRLYYELTPVDIDRYAVDGRYRQIMVAPREMETANLPADSRTFVNRHFKYTHGYGLVMTPVSDFTPDGLPEPVVRDIPPVSAHASLAVRRPEIYFGERTNDFVVVNSRAAEFDHPSADKNVYARYEGRGGVELRGFFRKLVFGWKLGGTRLLVSDYPTDESRIMWDRNVRERVAKIAPFLELDHDPYLVLVDGKLAWIVDGYTTSNYFPYSESTIVSAADTAQASSLLRGVNYVRNSVKAVVDAYDGSVTLYAFEPNDPIIRVWQRVFPDLLRPAHEMPAALRAHVRYPEELLAAQGLVYAKFHMTDPEVFYNQEDLWVRATAKSQSSVKVVEPYYVMWQPPGAARAEFISMQPFTPKNRQVLVGWVAAMCDGENYGRLLAYRFPKDKWILGPQQVETKIDQSPDLSSQLTLWDQRGKRVIRGNVLAIPIGQTILYVEPIYLQAESAAYPELRMVVAMHGDSMSYASTFKEALHGLFAPPAPVGSDRGAPTATTVEALERARRAFDEYVKLTSDGRFEEAGVQLRALRDALAPLGTGSPLPSR